MVAHIERVLAGVELCLPDFIYEATPSANPRICKSEPTNSNNFQCKTRCSSVFLETKLGDPCQSIKLCFEGYEIEGQDCAHGSELM